MKRGSLIIGLFLISLLFISGCVELGPQFGPEMESDIINCMTNYQEYCSEFDLNEDGFVNILDLVIATSGTSSNYFGQGMRDRGATMSIQSISSTSGAGNLEIYVSSTEDIYGFQFSLTGLYVSGASGGIATSNGYMFSTGCDGECVVGFNFAGDPIPTSSMPGVLVEISYSDHYGGEVCFKEGEGDNGPYNVVSADEGVELSTTWVDACGEGGVSGCNDQTACNYDADVTIPDGSCEYAEDNFDCDGNCVEEVDCTGECGGSAYEDNCGVCDIYPSNDDSTCTGCTDQNACNYDSDATISCTESIFISDGEDEEKLKNLFDRIKLFFMRLFSIQKSDMVVEGVISGLKEEVRENECCEYAEENYDCEGNCINYDCEYVCGGDAVDYTDTCAAGCSGGCNNPCDPIPSCSECGTATDCNYNGCESYPACELCGGNANNCAYTGGAGYGCIVPTGCDNQCGSDAEVDCSGECGGTDTSCAIPLDGFLTGYLSAGDAEWYTFYNSYGIWNVETSLGSLEDTVLECYTSNYGTNWDGRVGDSGTTECEYSDNECGCDDDIVYPGGDRASRLTGNQQGQVYIKLTAWDSPDSGSYNIWRDTLDCGQVPEQNTWYTGGTVGCTSGSLFGYCWCTFNANTENEWNFFINPFSWEYHVDYCIISGKSCSIKYLYPLNAGGAEPSTLCSGGCCNFGEPSPDFWLPFTGYESNNSQEHIYVEYSSTDTTCP